VWVLLRKPLRFGAAPSPSDTARERQDISGEQQQVLQQLAASGCDNEGPETQARPPPRQELHFPPIWLFWEGAALSWSKP